LQRETLFGSIALKLGVHPENLATEALNFILGGSDAARKSMVDAASLTGDGFVGTLVYRTQVAGEDNSIPDLIGFDENGRERLIVETKFWASLTENQPITYLSRLPPNLPAALLFIAPALRFPTLSAEILRRCQEKSLAVWTVSNLPERGEWQIGGGHRIVLVSWRMLLERLSNDVRASKQSEIADDVEQLQGLCARMDSEAFLPLRSEELTFTTPQRVLQFAEIVDQLTHRSVKEQLGSTKGFHAAHRLGQYGRYLRLGAAVIYLHTDLGKWNRLRLTPFWIELWPLDGKYWKNELNLLKPLENESPPRLIYDSISGRWVIPLFPKLAVEKSELIDHLFKQLGEVHHLLSSQVSSDTSALLQ
jgi:hypothetical protein